MEENCEIYEVWIGFVGVRIVDEWLFIFKMLKKYGYVMLFSEDVLFMGKKMIFFFVLFKY